MPEKDGMPDAPVFSALTGIVPSGWKSVPANRKYHAQSTMHCTVYTIRKGADECFCFDRQICKTS